MKHKDSLPKELMENHDEKREEDTQENSHSSEVKKKEERLKEPPIQEALDEKKTPTITQPPRLGFKEVKEINKSTKKITTLIWSAYYMIKGVAHNVD